MSVHHSPERGYFYSCMFGCLEAGYGTEQDAIDAFVRHRCLA